MKIQRFFARDMRTALADVTREMGADAVIVSSRRIGGGVELLAAIDYDPALFNAQSLDAEAPVTRPAATAVEPPVLNERVSKPLEPTKRFARTETSAPVRSEPTVNDRTALDWGRDPGIRQLQDEVRQLRGLMQEQLQGLASQDWQRRHPLQATLTHELTHLELTKALREHYARTEGPDVEHALANAYAAMARDIVAYKDDPISDGGVIALVGPTGVGKTTTAAKIAARCALRHGAQQVALISADSYRIGAHDQLATFARLIGCGLRTLSRREDLGDTLDALVNKRLIIIDCTGMSQRDARLAEELSMLQSDRYPIKRLLVLSAIAQRGAMLESVRQFGSVGLHGCVLTKIDEATSLGPAMSALIPSKLPLAFLCDGQRVPEDLRSGRGVLLVDRALKLAEQYRDSVDEWPLPKPAAPTLNR